MGTKSRSGDLPDCACHGEAGAGGAGQVHRTRGAGAQGRLLETQVSRCRGTVSLRRVSFFMFPYACYIFTNDIYCFYDEEDKPWREGKETEPCMVAGTWRPDRSTVSRFPHRVEQGFNLHASPRVSSRRPLEAAAQTAELPELLEGGRARVPSGWGLLGGKVT